MNTKIYTVFDSQVKAYILPQYYRNAGEATRAFTEAANDLKSNIGKYPAQYTMFEIGEFDDETGQTNIYESKISLGLAQQYQTINQ